MVHFWLAMVCHIYVTIMFNLIEKEDAGFAVAHNDHYWIHTEQVITIDHFRISFSYTEAEVI